MKIKIIKNLSLLYLGIFAFASCSKQLNLHPVNDLTPEKTYSTADGYKSVLAKVYGGLATTGNSGPAGASDIQGLDEGSQSPFIRGFFNCQELPTDEAIVSWNDQTIHDFHDLKFSSADPFIYGMYSRLVYNVTIANEYLRESTDDKLASRNITGNDATDIKHSRAEVRFLRAFNYWVLLDLFGKSTFVTEADLIGTALPKEISRTDLFKYIETELIAIDADLAPAKTIEYGRVDQAAAWALLSRLYLNANVYIGTPKYTEAITYAKKVIGAGYVLKPDYQRLFMADNDTQKDEFIFAVNCDGKYTQSYGNTTFLCHAPAGDDHDLYGVSDGWKGYRATKGLANLFPDLSGNTDKRAMFSNKDNIEIKDESDYTNGLHVQKYRNIRSDGKPTSDVQRRFSDIDFPIFRLPEIYLNYAEAVLRNGVGGDKATALNYINAIRQRANSGSASSNINASQLDLQFVLDERGRELYWEGFRRTDLIRYGQLTTGIYLWPWKGGVSSGTAVDSKYNLFPVPSADLSANPNLTQNVGY